MSQPVITVLNWRCNCNGKTSIPQRVSGPCNTETPEVTKNKMGNQFAPVVSFETRYRRVPALVILGGLLPFSDACMYTTVSSSHRSRVTCFENTHRCVLYIYTRDGKKQVVLGSTLCCVWVWVGACVCVLCVCVLCVCVCVCVRAECACVRVSMCVCV